MRHNSLVLTLLLSALSFGALGQTTSESTATYYSDPNQLKTNILDPILSDQEMVNADGTTFNAQAQCNAENEYLRVYATVQGDGDLDVSVVHDHNLDGAFSPTQVIPDIAGVCHNGYATNCSSDFQSCDFFEWNVDASLNISGTPSYIDQGDGVHGCYCINNSCGAGLYFVNQERIHDDIGMGISMAFQRANPSFGVTNVQTDSGVTSFYGHDPDTCDPGETNQHVYYDNPSSIPSAAFTAAGSSALFSQVQTAQNSGHSSTIQTCFEEHDVTLVTPPLSEVIKINSHSGRYSISTCGADCLNLRIGMVGDNYYTPVCGSTCGSEMFTETAEIEFNLADGTTISSVTASADYDDHFELLINDTLAFSEYNGNFSYSTRLPVPPIGAGRGFAERGNDSMGLRTVSPGVIPRITPGVDATYDFRLNILVGGEGDMFMNIRFQLDRGCTATPTVNNTCGSIPSDCYLDGEEIDGITTVSNTVGTGLVPLPSSRTFTVGSCSETISRPYWRIDRSYRCPASGSPYDFSQGLERAVVVNNSASVTGYNDRRFDGGTTINSSESLTLPTLPTVSNCEQSCKTRRTVDELGIATSGLAVGSRPDDTRYEYSYKACVDSTCPLEAGETIETPCGCMDRFSEAASAIQAFRLAGKDFVCTTETP
ncbi:hypothetical protein [Alteromonas macleodii]|uniref:MSHA biogenesis protein MshQ n=1 Tax=Alteromonas macleodii TaxID=28108 RepID=A0AB36FND9_ALTMA|nr:hypothetical protein [Alteromonas macleodii]OES24218.1 hypothetical protein BFV93_4818 [Alteromonas macleodii]OES24849.1 hypothetical protein BFV95_4608 [Alteromonas macleodii]OES25127.1 hypothetical protein BFV94_4598 [Alteromonas macleodii]OES39169.1 hypothetical protein BFV96_4317 [Alteromonas macleodii]